ncbi:MAG: hypothetical protein ABJA78_08645 [Ferruginibacter sp.]
MKKEIIIFLLSSILLTAANGQQLKKPFDYLSVSDLLFNKSAYSLSWTSHPTANFFKQEYLVKADNADRYNTMILIDVLTGTDNIKEIVAQKITELKKLKESNPVIRYETFDNTKSGEYMIDFVLTENSADGKYISIAERNVYRYKFFVDKKGNKSILLFGVSIRSYGNAVGNFLNDLKINKSVLVNEVAGFKIPEIKIIQANQ